MALRKSKKKKESKSKSVALKTDKAVIKVEGELVQEKPDELGIVKFLGKTRRQLYIRYKDRTFHFYVDVEQLSKTDKEKVKIHPRIFRDIPVPFVDILVKEYPDDFVKMVKKKK